MRNLELIAWTTLIFGVLLYFSDKNKTDKILEKDLSKKDIIFIGMLQILSLIPGVSRSGINITAGRFVKYSRIDSAKISFFLSIATLAAASLLGIYNISKEGSAELNFLAIIAVIFSFIFSYITIALFVFTLLIIL